MKQASGLEFQIQQRIEECSKRGFRLDARDQAVQPCMMRLCGIVIAHLLG